MIRKNLTSIALAAGLALGIAGCWREDPTYSYKSQIGNEQVETYLGKHSLLNRTKKILKVTKPDGKVITYIDGRWICDGIIDHVAVTKDGKTTRYDESTELGKEVLKKPTHNLKGIGKKLEKRRLKKH